MFVQVERPQLLDQRTQQVWCTPAGEDSPGAAGSVDAGHELPVGGTSGSEVLVAFVELEAQVDDLLFETSNLVLEGVDVNGGAEAGLAPGLLAEGFGEPPFQLLGSSVEPNSAFVGGEKFGLQ